MALSRYNPCFVVTLLVASAVLLSFFALKRVYLESFTINDVSSDRGVITPSASGPQTGHAASVLLLVDRDEEGDDEIIMKFKKTQHTKSLKITVETSEGGLRFEPHPKFRQGGNPVRSTFVGQGTDHTSRTEHDNNGRRSLFSSPSSSASSAGRMLSHGVQKVEDVTGWENVTCDACKIIVWTLKRMVMQKNTTDDIIKEVVTLCRVLHIESNRVCDYVVRQYAVMAIGVMQNTVLDPDDVCGVVLGDECAHPFNPFAPWNVTMSDTPKPPVTPHVKPKPRSPTLRVLHLTDIHLDIEYVEGADAECGEPLCCRVYDLNPAPNKSRRAGEWGDYRYCDLPYNALGQLFQHLADIRDKFDYVIFTGDIPAHDVWNQTQPQQLANMERLAKMFRKYLPDKPVYTTPGNHEGVPCNSFPPSSIPGESMAWFYSAYMQAWGYWLPDSTFSTIMRGGFYTFSPYQGLRIVSFNSNFGSSLNWWLFVNTTDPEGQLQWLADVLQDAENNGEKVHILSHIPPSEVLDDFALNYYRLVNRYENTIVGQFHGHTHTDEFEVFYDINNLTRPVGVSYIGGSVTAYSDTNSAYRIYTIDGNYNGSSFAVLDYTHYYLDIQLANDIGKPVWLKEYTASEAYQLPSLYPEDWNNLIYRMKDDDDLFQKYYKYYYKSAKHKSCTDAICKKGYLCQMKQAIPRAPELCYDL